MYLDRITAKVEKSKGKCFSLTLKEIEVVSRTKRADLIINLRIDDAKVIDDAQKSYTQELSWWEKNGKEEAKPIYEDSLKLSRDSALAELKKASSGDLTLLKSSGSLSFPEYKFLSAQILFENKPIKNASEVTFRYKGDEVVPVKDTEWSIERRGS